jgi:hypothetical protein
MGGLLLLEGHCRTMSEFNAEIISALTMNLANPTSSDGDSGERQGHIPSPEASV